MNYVKAIGGVIAYGLTRRYPDASKAYFISEAKKVLSPALDDFDVNFTPKYFPWDQRVCLAPDGDIFEAIKSKKASIVTDTIDRFTKNSIKLHSGKELNCDIVVLATGLRLQLLSDIKFDIDGKEILFSEKVLYKVKTTYIILFNVCFNVTYFRG